MVDTLVSSCSSVPTLCVLASAVASGVRGCRRSHTATPETVAGQHSQRAAAAGPRSSRVTRNYLSSIPVCIYLGCSSLRWHTVTGWFGVVFWDDIAAVWCTDLFASRRIKLFQFQLVSTVAKQYSTQELWRLYCVMMAAECRVYVLVLLNCFILYNSRDAYGVYVLWWVKASMCCTHVPLSSVDYVLNVLNIFCVLPTLLSKCNKFRIYKRLLLVSESWLKGSNTPSISSPVVDEERMRPRITFSALTLLTRWQGWHLDHK